MNKSKPLLNAILLFVSILISIICGLFQKNLVGYIISMLLDLYVLLSSINMKTEKKSYLFIIILSASLLIAFFGYSTVNLIIYKNDRSKYFESEEYYTETAKALEESLNNSAKNYYEPSYYLKNKDLNKIVISKYQAENEFNEQWFELNKDDLGVCDGYIVINVDQDYINYAIEQDKNDMYYDEYKIIDTLNVKSYISCSGKYTYKTLGYDESQILSTR